MSTVLTENLIQRPKTLDPALFSPTENLLLPYNDFRIFVEAVAAEKFLNAIKLTASV